MEEYKSGGEHTFGFITLSPLLYFIFYIAISILVGVFVWGFVFFNVCDYYLKVDPLADHDKNTEKRIMMVHYVAIAVGVIVFGLMFRSGLNGYYKDLEEEEKAKKK